MLLFVILMIIFSFCGVVLSGSLISYKIGEAIIFALV